MDKKALLSWYKDAGVDEIIGDAPHHFLHAPAPAMPETVANAAASNTPASKPATHLPYSSSESVSLARQLAEACNSIAELEAAVRAFDGCAIKKTASKTVFADGNPEAKILIIGEAPGAQEDRQGIPFCGPSGALLDKMLQSIGLDRTQVLISNTVYWRPPGNRQPSSEEVATCLPFVEKLVALLSPTLMILSGGTATQALLQKEQSISRLRGRFYEYSNRYMQSPVKTALLYHPSYLLRTPSQKRLCWSDLLMIERFLNGN